MENQELILFRIERLEKLSDKLDELVKELTKLNLNLATETQKVRALEGRVQRTEDRLDQVEEHLGTMELDSQTQISSLRLSMSERFGPGAIAGAAIAALAQGVAFLIKFLSGS